MDCSSYTAGIETTYYDQGRVTVNSSFTDLLAGDLPLTFDGLFNEAGGDCVKERDGLEIRRFRMAGSDELFFIKKHWQPFKGRAYKSEGLIEFAEYLAFRADGLATPFPVACGQKIQGDKLTSFLISQDFSPLVDLESIVLGDPQFFRGEEHRLRRQRVLGAIGRYARRMHDAGCNQKDFNATHILLGDIDLDNPCVALFDLQRVDRKIWQRLRWPVKALAELLFTLPGEQFDAQDHLFLFQSYIGHHELSFADRLLYGWIQSKRRRIARHSAKRNLAPKMGS